VSNTAAFGDKFIVPNQMNDVTLEQVELLFGKYFASKLFLLNKGVWHKPLRSKYGSHLVYITDKNVSKSYGFDEVQDRIYIDYMEEELLRRKKESYKKTSSQYILEVK
jgi:parvulin-like peptidyl-prolyl isomerase